MTTAPDSESPEPPQGRGRWVLTASSAVEYAFEGESPDREWHSLFTGAMIDGLRNGEADIDGDGFISIDDLYRFVHNRLREHNQTPQMWADSSGVLYLARSHAGTGDAGRPTALNIPAGTPLPPGMPQAAVSVLEAGTPVAAVSIAESEGRSFAVAGCEDGTLRVWDLAVSESGERRLSGHSGPVWGVAIGSVQGRPVVVSAGDDCTLRQWDLTTVAEAGRALIGHTALVNAVALASIGDQTVAISASDDNTIRRCITVAVSR